MTPEALLDTAKSILQFEECSYSAIISHGEDGVTFIVIALRPELMHLQSDLDERIRGAIHSFQAAHVDKIGEPRSFMEFVEDAS